MKKLLFLSTFIISVVTGLQAATITSTTTGGNWGTGSTWVGGNAPTSSDIVVINGPVSINGNYTCLRLTVNSSKTLSFSGSHTLTFSNSNWNQTCITNNGTFTTTNGTIEVIGGGVGLNITSNGSITIDRIILNNVRASFGSSTTINTNLKLINGAYFTGTHPNYASNATLEIAETISTNGNYYLWASGNGNTAAPNILISSGTVTAEQINLNVKKSISVSSGASFAAGKVCMYFESGFSGVTNSGTIRLGGITVKNGVTWNINSNYTISTLKIETGGIVNANSYALTIDNSLRNGCNMSSGDIMEVQSGGTFNAGTSTVIFQPAYYVSVNANSVSGGITFNNVTFGSNTVNVSNTSSMTVTGNIVVSSGATVNQPQNINTTSTTTVSNSGSTQNGSFPSTLPVAATGNSGGGSVTASYWAVTSPNDFTVSSNMTFTGTPKVVTIQEGAILAAGNYTITCDTVYIQGTFSTSNSSGLSGTFGSAVVIIGSNSTVTFSGTSGTQTITPRTDYVNMVLSGSATKSFASGTYEISGNFTVTGTNPSYHSGTVMRFDGTTQTISCPVFNTVEFTNSGTKTLATTTSVYNTLTMAGSAVLASDGNLTLVSDASGTARIAAIPATASITGNVNVQRYVPAVTRRYRVFSPSVQNFTFNDLKDDIFVTGSGGATNGFDVSSQNQTTAYTYQEATAGTRGWKAVTNINNSLTPGSGALVFVRGDRTLPAPQWYTAPYVSQNAVTIDFTGTINSGNISPVLTYNNTGTSADDGWNLVGNPYPSQISWNSITKSNLAPFYYTMDPVSGSYVANSGSNYIASGQGFFVQATSASPSLTFTENCKVSNTATNYFKTAIQPFEIRMVKDSINSDVAWLAFDNNASKGYNIAEDALKMTNSVINMGFYIDNTTMLQYSTVPAIQTPDTFIISAMAANGNYTLQFSNITSQANGQAVYLLDLFNNNIVDLATTTSYAFTITSAAGSKGNRFLLIIANPSQLPVSWMGLSGTIENNDVKLKWSTASEKNNSGFTVERSAGNQSGWITAGFVNGKGNSNTVNRYEFTDRYVFPNTAGEVYYRIKQTDKNGTISYSQTIVVNKGAHASVSKSSINVYPNPVNNNLNITSETELNESVIEIIDMFGKTVYRKEGTNGFSAELDVSSLAPGIYHVSLTVSGEQVTVSKLIKN